MDLYELLGVAKDATKREIKEAYRRLARKLHPDREGGDKEKFQEIQHAYMVLYDEKARANYDRTGEAGEKAKPTATQMAYENLAGLFTAIVTENVTNIHKIDIFKFMREKVVEAREGPEKLKRKNERNIKQYQRAEKKLKRKKKRSKHPKIMETVLSEQIRACRNNIRACDEDIEMYNLMLELMDDYDYEFDAPVDSRDTKEEIMRRLSFT